MEDGNVSVASALQLLNSLARDLDHMLNDLSLDQEPLSTPEDTLPRDRMTSDDDPLLTPDNDLLVTPRDVVSDQKRLLQISCNGNQEDSAVSSCSEAEDCPPAEMSTTERLIRSHPVWFLPGLHRSGAEHLLQGKPPGTFLVRQSSQAPTMALTVRLPPGKGPHVDHYLVHARDGKLALETSDRRFDNISSLIAHYSTRRDELPVKLQLPAGLQRVDFRHQLSSLALLGQEFWTCRLASCPSSGSTGADGSDQSSGASSLNKPHSSHSSLNKPHSSHLSLTKQHSSHYSLNQPHSSHSSLNQPHSSLSSIGSGSGGAQPDLSSFEARRNHRAITKSVSSSNCAADLSSTQPDKFLGSFGPRRGRQALTKSASANNCSTSYGTAGFGDTVVLNLVPLEEAKEAKESTFGLRRDSDSAQFRLLSPELVSRVSSPSREAVPPARVPPRPPPRWCKPPLAGQLSSPAQLCCQAPDAGSFGRDPGQVVSTATFQVSPAGAGGTVRSEMSVFVGGPVLSRPVGDGDGPNSITPGITETAKTAPETPDSPPTPDEEPLSAAGLAVRRRGRRKRSTHYQESAMLESAAAYCRSSVADKISDYEDIWASPARETPPAGSPFHVALSRASRDTACALADLAHDMQQQQRRQQHEKGHQQEQQQRQQLQQQLSRESAAPSPLYAVPADAVRPDPGTTGGLQFDFTEAGVGSKQSGSDAAMKSTSDPSGGQRPDVLPGVQRRGPSDRAAAQRRVSEPALRLWDPPGRAHRPTLATINSSEEVHALCASADNVAHVTASQPPRALPAAGRTQSNRAGGDLRAANPKSPPRRSRRGRGGAKPQQWRLDSSWEFLHRQESDSESADDEATPRAPTAASSSAPTVTEHPTAEISAAEQRRIVHAIIRQSLPLAVPPVDAESHASEYDNLRPVPGRAPPARADPEPETDTEACDVTKWESIMRLMSDQQRLRSGQFDGCEDRLFTDSESFVMARGEDEEEESTRLVPPRLPLPRSQQESLYSPPRLNSLRLHRKCQQSGAAIRQYVIQLANDAASTFALCIFNFLQCTREGSETDPLVVMRNIRQFINGMKNYLVKHGEADFHQVVHQERDKLSCTEFLNLDAILEGALEELLVAPLHDHISRLWRAAAQRSGATQRLAEQFELARGRSAAALGVKPTLPEPPAAVLASVRHLLGRMQDSASPLDKLECLLATVSALFASAGSQASSLPADDFLPLLLYTLVHCHVTNVEFEADYMWGLLHPLLLHGEAGYYLTMLSSAVHVLKNLQHHLDDRSRESTGRLSDRSGSCSGSEPVEGFLRVLIPDEQQGTILSRTLPARPGMTAREVCKMLDHRLRITSPQDYGLFKLINGEETLVGDLECPQAIKQDLSAKGIHCMLAYKRLEAKIAWPTGQL